MPANSKIINNVIDEISSKEEAKEVVEWLSSSIEGREHLSDMIDRDAYLMETEVEAGKVITPRRSELLFRKIDKRIRNNQYKKISLKVAAVLLPLIIVLGIGIYVNSLTSLFESTKYVDLYIPKGENARVFFQDGTEVFLNADTRIRYPERFGLKNREVYLDGEAYFNVVSNSKRPFLVHTHDSSVEVLGTSFNVNAYSENETVKVVLDKGKTSFKVNQGSYTMSPGQQIEYNKSTGITTLYNLSKSSNVSLWKENTLYFHDTPIIEVIKVLERKYDVQFHMQSPGALNYTYTLTTKQLHLEDLLHELQKIAPVKFDIKDENVFVTI